MPLKGQGRCDSWLWQSYTDLHFLRMRHTVCLSKRQPLFTLVTNEHIFSAKFLFVRKGSGARAMPLLSTFWFCPPDFARSAQLHDLFLHPNLSEITESDKDTFPHWLTLPPTLTANVLQVTPGGFSEPWRISYSDPDTEEVTVEVSF